MGRFAVLIVAGIVVLVGAVSFCVYGLVTDQHKINTQATQIATLTRGQQTLRSQTTKIAGIESQISSDDKDIGLLLGIEEGNKTNSLTDISALVTASEDYAADINCLEGDITDIEDSTGSYSVCIPAPG